MVAKALATNKVLKSLDLQQAQIGVPGGKAIAAALKANIPLMNLKLHYNHLGPEGALRPTATQAWEGCAASPPAMLTRRPASSKGPGPGQETAFIPALSRPPRASGVGAIAAALKTNTHLTNLNLGDNGMMKEGVEALASMLQSNTKLLRLDCSKNAGLWGNDEMKAVLTAAGEKHEAKRQAAKKTIPQDSLPFRLIMEDSPGQMWSPTGFVNLVKYPKQRRPKTNRDEPVVI